MFLMQFRLIGHKSTKKLKNLKIFRPLKAKFCRFGEFLYLCSMKRIAYIAPVDYMRGNMSGRQDIEYNAGSGYDVPDGTKQAADYYMPRLVAKVHAERGRVLRYFQVRTKTSVHMTANMRTSMAVMGGAGALYAALVSDKTSTIYNQVMTAASTYGAGQTFRGYVMRALMDGLRQKDAQLTIATGVYIVNPWVSSATPNVPVSQAIIDKFASVLSL